MQPANIHDWYIIRIAPDVYRQKKPIDKYAIIIIAQFLEQDMLITLLELQAHRWAICYVNKIIKKN